MTKLCIAAFVASLAAFPAFAHAQADNARPQGPQGVNQAQHDHSASASGERRTDSSAMPRRPMRGGMHMENCSCPCCAAMMQHGGGMTHPGDGETADPSPEQPEDHQH
jgi:hypothetical protein